MSDERTRLFGSVVSHEKMTSETYDLIRARWTRLIAEFDSGTNQYHIFYKLCRYGEKYLIEQRAKRSKNPIHIAYQLMLSDLEEAEDKERFFVSLARIEKTGGDEKVAEFLKVAEIEMDEFQEWQSGNGTYRSNSAKTEKQKQVMTELVGLLRDGPKKVAYIRDYFLNGKLTEYETTWDYVKTLARREKFNDPDKRGTWRIPEDFDVEAYLPEDFDMEMYLNRHE